MLKLRCICLVGLLLRPFLPALSSPSTPATDCDKAGAPVYIYRDLGGVSYWVWFVTANLLATAAISPFVGALSDLMGRRYVAIIGSVTIILGQIICGTARGMDMFIGECFLSPPLRSLLPKRWG